MVNKADNDALEAQFESQFQKPGDLVENDDTGITEIESLCMDCHEQGITRLLLLRVPHFREVILESFECPHCHSKNNSVKSAGQIQEQGAKYKLRVENEQDMSRQVIRSDVAICKLEDLGIEMPKESQLTNIEGVVQRIHENLSSDQDLRKEQAPELHDALVPIIASLKKILDRDGAFPFTVSLDDPTGNSWIAPNTADNGVKYGRYQYHRTPEQNEELGISADAQAVKADNLMNFGNPEDLDILDGQVFTIHVPCPACSKTCRVNIKKLNIPHFKEVFVWGTVCDGIDDSYPGCGYKSSEVRTGGAVPEKGKIITLRVENELDLSRDILKSDTCELICDDLGMNVEPGTLGGRFTTVEGLLVDFQKQLKGTVYSDLDETTGGDGMISSDKEHWEKFFKRLDEAMSGKLKFSITLKDPMANSYVQDLCIPEIDPQLSIEDYIRSEQEEDDLGLKHMKTEGYEQDNEEAHKE